MQFTFTTGLDHLSPLELGQVHGQALAELAVELRLKGLQPEVWAEFMKQRVAALTQQFTAQEEVDEWAKALIKCYQDAIDNNMQSLLLMAQTGAAHDPQRKALSSAANQFFSLLKRRVSLARAGIKVLHSGLSGNFVNSEIGFT